MSKVDDYADDLAETVAGELGGRAGAYYGHKLAVLAHLNAMICEAGEIRVSDWICDLAEDLGCEVKPPLTAFEIRVKTLAMRQAK